MMTTTSDVEICRVLVGRHIRSLIIARFLDGQYQGTPSSVEFSWKDILAREEHYGDVWGFYHTHPLGFYVPSKRDVQTMRAWVSCFEKPLLCVIRSGTKVNAYLFHGEKGKRVCFIRILTTLIWKVR